ncbi:hypothetical protein QQF64_006858 [Cirrhinus molitorella]|uniref:Uncharacterized protein n=1 Tax=Cirrhinus molitorella TaxID=172907 RepID=A0ABR3M911_9TELE
MPGSGKESSKIETYQPKLLSSLWTTYSRHLRAMELTEDQLGEQMHQHQHLGVSQHDQHHHYYNAVFDGPMQVSPNRFCTPSRRKVVEQLEDKRNVIRTTSMPF